MHVALLTHHYPPEVGAPQRRWQAFVQRFVADGHRVTVLTPPPHYPNGRPDGELPPEHRAGACAQGESGETILRVRFRTHGPGLRSRSVDQAVAAADSVVAGRRYFRRPGNRPDVIIATAPGLPTIPAGMALGRLLGRPVVVEMRDAWPDLIGPSGMFGPDDRRSAAVRRLVTTAHRAITRMQRDAAAVVTTTRSFGQILRDRGVKRVQVVRNGSTLEQLPTLPPPADHAGLNVLYLGTIGRSQGLSAAVDAATIARTRGLDLTLRIVGSGAAEPELRARATLTGAPVQFMGRVPRSEVADHYAWADTVVVSLRDWQPFEWTIPSKLYEVMGTGRHVSGALRGEAAEIVTGAGAGFVVPPEDAEALAAQWLALGFDRGPLRVDPMGRDWVLQNAHHDSLAAEYLDLLSDVASARSREGSAC